MQQSLGSGALIIWADNCGGQNKNQFMVGLAAELSDPDSPFHNFRRVDIRFPAVGHTFLACDRAFSVVERFAKGKDVQVPFDLVDVVRKSFSSPQHVEMIAHSVFRDYKKLFSTKYSILNKHLLAPFGSEKIIFTDIMWFNLNEFETSRHPGELWFKYCLDKEEPWRKVKIIKRTAPSEPLGSE